MISNTPLKPMDEDDALEHAEAEIRRLKTQVEWLNKLVDRARETMVQHNPTCLLWLETVDAVRTGKI